MMTGFKVGSCPAIPFNAGLAPPAIIARANHLMTAGFIAALWLIIFSNFCQAFIKMKLSGTTAPKQSI
jgi:hypothetical protein